MKSPFFVIANYNVDPSDLVEMSKGQYVVIDQSDSVFFRNLLYKKYENKIIQSHNFGHNLVSYLDFIIENYANLPPLIAFLKGNMIGRHLNQDYLVKCIKRQRYSFLWEDAHLKEKANVQYRLSPGKFLEINNSWYAWDFPHRYFTNLNEFLNFFFVDYSESTYVSFAPGGCYLVESERILENPLSLYKAIRKIVAYEYRPAEAFMLERSLPLFFDRFYELKNYCFDHEEISKEIEKLPDRTFDKKLKHRTSLGKRMRYKLAKTILSRG